MINRRAAPWSFLIEKNDVRNAKIWRNGSTCLGGRKVLGFGELLEVNGVLFTNGDSWNTDGARP
jgi:hypothetical protein